MKNYRVQESVLLPTKPTCLSCGYSLDGAAALKEGGPREHRPGAGDITVCIKCGHIMAYADEGSFRELTDQEVRNVAGDERLLLIQRLRRMHEQRAKTLSRRMPPGDQTDSGAASIPSGGAGADGKRQDLSGGDDR